MGLGLVTKQEGGGGKEKARWVFGHAVFLPPRLRSNDFQQSNMETEIQISACKQASTLSIVKYTGLDTFKAYGLSEG